MSSSRASNLDTSFKHSCYKLDIPFIYTFVPVVPLEQVQDPVHHVPVSGAGLGPGLRSLHGGAGQGAEEQQDEDTEDSGRAAAHHLAPGAGLGRGHLYQHWPPYLYCVTQHNNNNIINNINIFIARMVT